MGEFNTRLRTAPDAQIDNNSKIQKDPSNLTASQNTAQVYLQEYKISNNQQGKIHNM